MSATNKTQHYNLPQFVAGDIPAWMTDVNNAMATIDGAIYDVASDEATVGESVAQLGSRVTTAENTVASLGTTVQTVQGAVAENTADIATLEGNVNGLGTRVTTVEGKTTAVEGNLTANNKRFQFAYDSTEQKYGYTLDGVFHPFDDSADFQNELYEALQYSGLVEEGDTVEEMLEALSEYFPQIVELIPVLTSNVGSNGVASASAEYNGEAYKAMDGNNTTAWQPLAGTSDTSGTGWVMYTFTNPVRANKLVVGCITGFGTYKSSVPATYTVSYIDTENVEHTLATKNASAEEIASGFDIDFTTTDSIKSIKVSLGSRNCIETNDYYYVLLTTIQLKMVG